MPAGVGAVDDLVEAGVAGRVVAEQHVIGSATEECPLADQIVGGRRRANLDPAETGAGHDLVEAGVTGRIVAEQDVRGAVAVKVRTFHRRCCWPRRR